MKQLIEFPLDTNESVWVEVELPEDEYGSIEVGRLDELRKQASQSFQEALAVVKPVAESLITKLSNLSERPNEIDVEFGLKLDNKLGAVISSTGVEAHFKVTLKWKRE